MAFCATSPAPTGSDAGPGNADREMGLAGSGAADQHEVALVIEEVSGRQIADQGLVDLSCVEVELFQFLGERQLGNGHLVFDRPGSLLADLGREKVADDLLWFLLSLEGGADDLIIGCPHAVELQLAHCVQHF